MPESKASHQHRERSPWQAGNVEAYHIDRFRSKFSVVALATGFTDQIDVVLTQKAPNILKRLEHPEPTISDGMLRPVVIHHRRRI
jgi:hypothetical protein